MRNTLYLSMFYDGGPIFVLCVVGKAYRFFNEDRLAES